MLRFSLIVLTVLISVFSFAKNVPVNPANTVAVNFYKSYYNAVYEKSPDNITVKETIVYSNAKDTFFYIFNIKEGGFVIVSAEDAVTPVLGYSFTGEFKKNIDNGSVKYLMNYYSEVIKAVRESKTKQAGEIKALWRNYLSGFQEQTLAYVLPLLTTQWDQDCYYNYYAPSDVAGPCNHVYEGCVATSMAQVMKYHNFPATGYGSHSYTHPNYGTLSANFGSRTYSWTSMPNKLVSNTPLAQKQAVSRLMTDCGISVDMNYSPNGSGTSSAFAADALSDYFRYNYSAKEISASSYTATEWTAILRGQIDKNRPVIYSGTDISAGAGHAWVLDGYTGNYFHMNWGWSGYYDGNFLLTNLTPGNSNYNANQDAVINIVPTGNGCSGNTVYTSKAGRIEDGSGVANYGNNLNCSWRISPPAGNIVVLNFKEFNTESGNDVVKVYDGTSTSGTLLGTFSGSSKPQMLIANSGNMFITFTTNGSVTKPGWKADWTNQVPIYCTNLKFMTAVTATFDDGSGANNYGNNSKCKWLLKPSGASYVSLVFREFDLHPTDHLYVYNGSNTSAPLLGSFTGTNLPPNIKSTQGSMLLYFVTSSSFTAGGWKVSYYKNDMAIPGEGDDGSIKVFPNPATSRLNIEFDNKNTTDAVVYIVDNQGRTLLTKNRTTLAANGVFVVDISELSSGYYFVRVVTGSKTVTMPFVKR